MPSPADSLTTSAIEAALHLAYVGVHGASLRDEDRKKAQELLGLLREIARLVSVSSAPFSLVDAAAGKAFVGLLAMKLLVEPAGRAGRLTVIEREQNRVDACERARLALGIPTHGVTLHQGDVGDATCWPPSPDVVVALHACGDATDRIIDAAAASNSRYALIVPCCVAASLEAAERATRRAKQLGLPNAAPVRRAFVEAWVMGERIHRMEANGYETVALPFVAPTVTPHNVLLRGRRLGDPVRMQRAREALSLLRTA